MPHVDTSHSFCGAGLARAEITPPVGIYHRLWGAALHDRATGVHRPLTATALVLQAAEGPLTPEKEQVLLAVDLCLLGAAEMASLREHLCGVTGLAQEQVVVAFSHSHASGLMNRDRQDLPGGELIAPYLEDLAVRLTALVTEARRTVQPVAITYAAGRCSLAGQRDFWDEDSRQFVCGFNPQGPADDTLLVARVTSTAGRTVATVVNYACHPTTLAWQNTLISPDFPGALRDLLERETGAPCIYLQGASGDLGPREGYVGDPTVADRNGRQLGYAALSVLESLPPPGTRFQYKGPVVSGATLGTWAHVPLDATELAAKRRWQLRRWVVDLPYRPGLPTLESTEAERTRWLVAEAEAWKAGDPEKARDYHALAERATRWRTRLAVLPPGVRFPLPVSLWRIGDAAWLAVEGELYSIAQRVLRQRFAGMTIVFMTLANGSRVTYLPPADTYGKGIYQESIALLAPGCLEHLLDAIGQQLQSWLA
jgi:hypothetical protein